MLQDLLQVNTWSTCELLRARFEPLELSDDVLQRETFESTLSACI